MRTSKVTVTVRCPHVMVDADGGESTCNDDVEVELFVCPAEPMTWDYPGSPASIEINDYPDSCKSGHVFTKAECEAIGEQIDKEEFDWPDDGGYDD